MVSPSWPWTHGGRTEGRRALPPISLEMRQKPQREEETDGRTQGRGTRIPGEHGWRHLGLVLRSHFTPFSAAVCLKPPPHPCPAGGSETSWLLWFAVLAPREAERPGQCLCVGTVTAGAQGKEEGQGQTHTRKPPMQGVCSTWDTDAWPRSRTFARGERTLELQLGAELAGERIRARQRVAGVAEVPHGVPCKSPHDTQKLASATPRVWAPHTQALTEPATSAGKPCPSDQRPSSFLSVSVC